MSIAEKILNVRKTVDPSRLSPEIRDRIHIYSSRDDKGSVEQQNYGDYARVYSVHSWVRKAIRILSDSIAPLPIGVKKGEDIIENHPITILFEHVNDEMGPDALWKQWCSDMMLGGESFFQYYYTNGGKIGEVWPLSPDEMYVRADTSEERKYAPRVAGYSYPDEEFVIEPQFISHDKFYNPLNKWRGLAPISAVREGIVIDILAQTWSKMFLKGGARPDYALLTPQGLTEDERNELETKLAFKFGGVENAHKPIILESGITDVKTFSFTPKDIEWLEQRKFARDEIAAIFGVPDELMGFGKDTYQNFKTAYRVFWQLTVMNLIGHRDRFLTHFFTKTNPQLKEGEIIVTDTSGVGALQEEITPKVDSVLKLWSIGVPFNTLDRRMGLGIGEIPGGEQGYVPYSLIPVGGEHVLGAEIQGRPPVDPTPDALVGDVMELIEQGQVMKQLKAPTHPWVMFDRMLTPHEQRMQRSLKKEFQEQQNEALRNLRGWDYSSIIEHEEIKGILPGIKDLLNWGKVKDRIVGVFRKDYNSTAEDFGQVQLDSLNTNLKFDLRSLRESINLMEIRLADDINQTTQYRIERTIKDILIEATEDNWTMEEYQKQIYEQISSVFDVRKSDYETWRIAQNEMHKIATTAQYEAMKQAGVKFKRWISMMDPPRARPGHMDAHRNYIDGIPIFVPFIVNGFSMMHPGDGPISETIGCRCFSEAVVTKPRT